MSHVNLVGQKTRLDHEPSPDWLPPLWLCFSEWCSAGVLVIWYSAGSPLGGPAHQRVCWCSWSVAFGDPLDVSLPLCCWRPKEGFGFSQHTEIKPRNCYSITQMVLTKIITMDSSLGQSTNDWGNQHAYFKLCNFFSFETSWYAEKKEENQKTPPQKQKPACFIRAGWERPRRADLIVYHWNSGGLCDLFSFPPHCSETHLRTIKGCLSCLRWELWHKYGHMSATRVVIVRIRKAIPWTVSKGELIYAA